METAKLVSAISACFMAALPSLYAKPSAQADNLREQTGASCGFADVRAELARRTLPKSFKRAANDAVFAEISAADTACDEAWRRCATKEELFACSEKMRGDFIRAIGGLPEKRCPLNAKTVARVKRDGYVVEKLLFESWPGIHVPANLYIPDDPKFKAPYPAILLTCGHSNSGKGSSTYQRGCVLAAKSGMACLIYDPFDQGERMQGKGRTVGAHNRAGALAALLGGGMARFRIWDGMRALDYLESRSEVDASRMGVMGNSGGGTVTSLLMATEPRLKAACPSCYISTYFASARKVGPGDAEQNTFGQFSIGVNNASFALMQPMLPVRFMFAHSDFFPFKGSIKTFALVKETASRFGLGDFYSMTDVDGPHGWKESTRVSSVEWMRRWLCDDATAFKHDLEGYRALDKTFNPENCDMGIGNGGDLCCPGGKVMNIPGERTIYDLIRDEYAAALAARTESVTPETVRRIAQIDDADTVNAVRKEVSRRKLASGIEVVRMTYAWPNGFIVPVVEFSPPNAASEKPLLVVGNGQKEQYADDVCAALSARRVVAVADLSGAGETNDFRRRFYRAQENEEETAVLLYSLGRSLVGVHAGEILSVAADMKSRLRAPIEVVAHERVCIGAAHARFVRPDIVTALRLENPPQSWKSAVKTGARIPFANVVNGALRHYDWTDLCRSK